ncbi:MAG TPA: AAA family ATPase [Candidatus Lokiarchaeia archaeon]|nr:AAA family ATPase [Candidatus Lokiarchaeia archaeon]
MAEITYIEKIRKKFGWEDFPFSLDLIPEVFAGKEKILNPIMEQLAYGSIIFIEGNYGSGKSQILKHMQFKIQSDPAYSAKYIPILIQEPLNTDVLIHAFQRKLKIESSIVLVGDLIEELEARLKGQTVILLIDEAQEMTIQEKDTEDIIEEKNKTLQWVRVLSDFRGCRMFLTGLTNFGKKLADMFRPIDDRVTLKFFLKPMDFETTADLIQQRMAYFSINKENVLSPFTEDALEAIFQKSGGYPRAILKTCQDAVIDMLNKGRDSITAENVLGPGVKPKEIALAPTAADADMMGIKDLEREMKDAKEQVIVDSGTLAHTELQVLKYMATREEVTPQEVAEGCNITPGTAANVLRKAKEMGFCFRKKQGRTYSYTLYSVYRREFTQA